MNPFVAFLILVPLILGLVLWAGTILTLITYGPSWGIIVANLIIALLCFALIYLLVRMSRGDILDDKEIRHLSAHDRRRLTGYILFATYVTLFLLLLVITNLASLRNWLGILSIVMSLSMLISTISEARRTRALQANVSELYLRLRNRLFGAVLLTACSMVVVFWIFNGGRYISHFDFFALLTLFVSSGLWMVSKIKRLTLPRSQSEP